MTDGVLGGSNKRSWGDGYSPGPQGLEIPRKARDDKSRDPSQARADKEKL